MTDFHTHILPHMDDGSQSRAESVELLRRLRVQGVDEAVLTPHFYPQQSNPEEFLRKRRECYDRLLPLLTNDMPSVRLGAEVYYFEGISRLPELPLLRIEGTDFLLLEMPERPLGELILRELTDLACRSHLIPVLAHVERFLPYQKSGTLELLLSRGLKAQINAEFFLHWSTKRRALQMLRSGQVTFLGSDCHNLSDRKPRMDEAFAVISQKLGGGFLAEWEAQTRLPSPRSAFQS